MKAPRRLSAPLGRQVQQVQQILQRPTASTSALRHYVQRGTTTRVGVIPMQQQRQHRQFATSRSIYQGIESKNFSAQFTTTNMAATESHAAHTWDQRPPYAYPVQGEASFEKRLEGKCQCGRVRYWIKSDRPLSAKFCHCRGCQLLHGAPFQWAAIFHKDDMVFENGTKDLVFYHSGEKTLGHDLPCKISCAHCRSPIMDEGRRMVLLFPTLLKFKDKAARDLFYPQCHIFYSARVVDIPDGKPKWDGLDSSSLLLDNEP